MLAKRIFIIGSIGIMGVLLLVWVAGEKEGRSLKQKKLEFIASSEQQHSRSDLYFSSKLPLPVQRYLDQAIPAASELIRRVNLQQTGVMRLDPSVDTWTSFTANQLFITRPPGFIWHAEMKMGLLMPVTVIDSYQQGVGQLQAKMLNLFTLADESNTKELNSGELLRYLAESVWFPTALLPSQRLQWQAVDDSSATATLIDADNTVSMTFHFNEANEIVRATAQRFRLVGDQQVLSTWNGYYTNYQRRDGFMIPTEAWVSWGDGDDEWQYWRGRVDSIEYQ